MYSFERHEVWFDTQNSVWCVIHHVLIGLMNLETSEIQNCRSLSRLIGVNFKSKEEAQVFASGLDAK